MPARPHWPGSLVCGRRGRAWATFGEGADSLVLILCPQPSPGGWAAPEMTVPAGTGDRAELGSSPAGRPVSSFSASAVSQLSMSLQPCHCCPGRTLGGLHRASVRVVGVSTEGTGGAWPPGETPSLSTPQGRGAPAANQAGLGGPKRESPPGALPHAPALSPALACSASYFPACL